VRLFSTHLAVAAAAPPARSWAVGAPAVATCPALHACCAAPASFLAHAVAGAAYVRLGFVKLSVAEGGILSTMGSPGNASCNMQAVFWQWIAM
jgi:hypothetical protein